MTIVEHDMEWLLGDINDGAAAEDVTTDYGTVLTDIVAATPVTRRKPIVIASGLKRITDTRNYPYLQGFKTTGMGGIGQGRNDTLYGLSSILEWYGTTDVPMFEIEGAGSIWRDLSFNGGPLARQYSTGTVTVVNGVVELDGSTFPNTGEFSSYVNANIQIGEDANSNRIFHQWYHVASYDDATHLTLDDTSVNISTASAYVLQNYAPEAVFNVDNEGQTGFGAGKHSFENLWFNDFDLVFSYISTGFTPPASSNIDVCAMTNIQANDVHTMMKVEHSQGMQWNCEHWRIGGCRYCFDFRAGGALFARNISMTSYGTLLRLENDLTLGGIGRSNGQFIIDGYKKDSQGTQTMLEVDGEFIAEVLFRDFKLSGAVEQGVGNVYTLATIGNITAGITLTCENFQRIPAASLTFDSTTTQEGRVPRYKVINSQVEDDVTHPRDIIDTANSVGRCWFEFEGGYYESKQAVTPRRWAGWVYADSYTP